MFSPAVCARLKYYVYRLIDPRNGETFYVGKGKDNRVFMHAKQQIGEEDASDKKLQRIREIVLDGFEVQHVIHRHGMDETTAFEVEAALIEAYPEVTNVAGGHASDERGLMHSTQIIERYEAEEAVFHHKALLIQINRSATERGSIYGAVSYAWKISPEKAQRAAVVLAVLQGLIVGVFVPEKWVEATRNNFPGLPEDRMGRWGFIGHEAPADIGKLYLRRRVPAAMRKPGAANPVRYTFT